MKKPTSLSLDSTEISLLKKQGCNISKELGRLLHILFLAKTKKLCPEAAEIVTRLEANDMERAYYMEKLRQIVDKNIFGREVEEMSDEERENRKIELVNDFLEQALEQELPKDTFEFELAILKYCKEHWPELYELGFPNLSEATIWFDKEIKKR